MSKLSSEEKLMNVLKEMGSVAICFSGGVDSTLLAAAAERALPEDKFLLFHAISEMLPRREHEFAMNWTRENDLPLRLIRLKPLEDSDVVRNDQQRCYYCKKIIMRGIIEAAKAAGMAYVADGYNLDDIDDYRPGTAAAEELGVRHPLLEAGFDKKMIRELSHEWGIPNYDSPASACLASRVPYGKLLDAKSLKIVDAAEEYLQDIGFAGCRVRLQGKNDARIELRMADLAKAAILSTQITEKLKRIGFENVLLDLSGYRRGGGFNPKK
ncbi:MAG: ATP-dependent sacrificial sulfur transferase LarE [Lentisphaerae bacterium]|nr:ATP-dependent sacrificial sulfur transferase LarE [Lentisphaerota bacterium]MCP4100307.1 ATP-dependent sacrificial sulfur transferase LarE [Lentisphaerota bacterium]